MISALKVEPLAVIPKNLSNTFCFFLGAGGGRLFGRFRNGLYGFCGGVVYIFRGFFRRLRSYFLFFHSDTFSF